MPMTGLTSLIAITLHDQAVVRHPGGQDTPEKNLQPLRRWRLEPPQI
jgi:hypothetical protein